MNPVKGLAQPWRFHSILLCPYTGEGILRPLEWLEGGVGVCTVVDALPKQKHLGGEGLTEPPKEGECKKVWPGVF